MFLYSRTMLSENNLSIASALQLSNPGLCNLKLCVTLGGTQKVLLS